MSRRLGVALAAGAALLASTPVWGPSILRRVSWFEVQKVEISGTRLLAPHQVLAAAGVRPQQNVWDDPGRLESALRAHPAIASASVSRRLPHTLRIRVEEKRAVAYVEMGTLAPITARGEVLPIDPTRSRIDLPVIRAAWTRTPLRVRSAILGETDRLGRLDPALLAGVSEIRVDASARVLFLTHPLAEIVVPIGADATRLAQLRAVLGDMERRMAAPDPQRVTAPARVDLRFGEQIVVRIPSSV